jgi:hypothetical protein
MTARLGLLIAVLVVSAAIPLAAHHSFALEYDGNKPIMVTGTVTRVEWTNPHARFYVDAMDDKGEVTNWNFELASPSALARNGWSSRTLKVGDKVTIKGFGARAAANRVNAKSVITADGRAIFTGPGDDDYKAQ